LYLSLNYKFTDCDGQPFLYSSQEFSLLEAVTKSSKKHEANLL